MPSWIAYMFQFQNGAIKRELTGVINLPENMFQFQNGAIKRKNRTQYYCPNKVSIPKWCD